MKILGFDTTKVASGALLGLLVILVAPSQSARAEAGTSDVVPAATLLLPYFETDLANENGKQTAFRITNSSATAILVNVTLWTDLGVPTFSFPIYQPGFASTDVDLRLLFKGILPITASAGQDPTGLISPQGDWSQDINFASCGGVIPFTGLLPTATLTALRNAHTGLASTSLGGNCGGVPRGDSIARGYITMDTVNQCGGPATPADVGYFLPGGAGRGTYQNVMTGTVTYLERSQNYAFGEPLVHIESNGFPGSGTSYVAGDNTFYGRYNAYSGGDNREPLMSISQSRYLNGGALAWGTDFIVWRDPGVAITPFACGAIPAAFPMTQNEIKSFDEQENVAFINGNFFPYASQLVGSATVTSQGFGFLRLNLTMPTGVAAVAGRHQSHVSFRHTAAGNYGGQAAATQIINASRPANENFIIGN